MINDLIEDGFDLNKDELEKIKNHEIRYYEGSACDEEGGLEAFLCDTGINFETDKIKIKSGGSY